MRVRVWMDEEDGNRAVRERDNRLITWAMAFRTCCWAASFARSPLSPWQNAARVQIRSDDGWA